MKKLLERIVFRLRHGRWPEKIRRPTLPDPMAGTMLVELCPRCGLPECPGPASCLAETLN